MNLYKITINFNKNEFYLTAKTMSDALERATEKYTSEIIGVRLITKGVE